MESENSRLKLVRKTLKLSQLELSKALNMKQGSLSDIERGKDGLGVSSNIKLGLQSKYRVNIDFIENGVLPIILEEEKFDINQKAPDYRKLDQDEIHFVTKALENNFDELMGDKRFKKEFLFRASDWVSTLLKKN